MATRGEGDPPIDVFISYSHRDEGLKNDLRKHLSLLKRQGEIRDWHDREIEAGLEWSREIDAHLESADIILLLVSPDFLASDFCFDVEMRRAIERHDEGVARVIPVFLRPCDWKGAPFGKLQGLPTDAEPVTSRHWSNTDEALAVVAGGIRQAVVELRRRGHPARTFDSQGSLYMWLKALLAVKRPPPAARALERWKRTLERNRKASPNESTPESRRLLAAYDMARRTSKKGREAPADSLDSHTRVLANSLADIGTTAVAPLTVRADDGVIVLLEFVTEAYREQNAELFVHPLAESALVENRELSTLIGRMWERADPGTEAKSTTSVLWRVRAATALAPLLRSPDSTDSALAAVAYRVFWHLRRDLSVDPDVYVVGTVTRDGELQSLHALPEHIAALRGSHKSPVTPTIVGVGSFDRNATDVLQTAANWASIEVVTTPAELVSIRSHTAQTALRFLKHIAAEYDKTPWVVAGRPVRLSEVYIPPHVWKEERRLADPSGGSDNSEWRPVGYDPAAASREVGPRLKERKRQVRVAWDHLFSSRVSMLPLIVVGGPGLGKSTLLAWTARQLALQASLAISNRTASVNDVAWPILADLDTWTQQLGSPTESLSKAALIRSAVPEDWNALRVEALREIIHSRLQTHTRNTAVFCDALDQVRDSAVSTLQQRLYAISGRSGRIVVSTREAALGRANTTLPFPRMTVVQVAALEPREASELAAKWLDTPHALQLDGHLRSHAALAVVADSPLLLTLACLVAAARPTVRLPETAGALYREIMHALALGAWRQTAAAPLTVEDVEAFLADTRRMAWRLFCIDPHANRFVRESLVRGFLDSTGVSVAEANRRIALLVTLGFIEGTGRDDDGEPTYHFRHATFREFLVASYLSSEINREGWSVAEVAMKARDRWANTDVATLIDQGATDPGWEPIVVFVAGLLKNPVPLLEQLADSKRDDHFRHRLSLLCKCYGALAAEKEGMVASVMEPVFRYMAKRGHRAIEQSPHKWRQWLADIASLLVLPTGAQRVSAAFLEPCGDEKHHRVHMQSHELLELLKRSSSGLHWKPATDGLLNLCVSGLGHNYDIERAARWVVEIAEQRNDESYLLSLAAAVDDSGVPAWRRVPIAGTLLRAKNDMLRDRSLDYLLEVTRSNGVEEWIRSQASVALVHGINGSRQAEIAKYILSFILDGATSYQLRRDMASEVLREVEDQQPTPTTVSLVHVFLLMGRDDVEFTQRCVRILSSWGITRAVEVAVKQFWRLARSSKQDCYPRTAALRALLEFGKPKDRPSAVRLLTALLDAPVEDGCQQYLALEALLEAGERYEPGLRRRIRDLALDASVSSIWVVHTAELALAQGDLELLRELNPTFLAIASDTRADPHGERSGWSGRDGAIKLLRYGPAWADFEASALARLRSQSVEQREDWHSLNVAIFSGRSSDLLALTTEFLAIGTRNFRPWHRLLHELDSRGWRLSVHSNRKISVLHSGQEEPRPDAELWW